MPCYHPLHAWYANETNPSGKRSLVFKPQSGAHEKRQIAVPCGQCIGCRLERSRQWAIRCLHEASMHSASCFITLTYDQAHMPSGGTLVLDHFQRFMKRLRKDTPHQRIRFFHCGEYGAQLQRPHYHALLFGERFNDRTFWSERNGIKLHRSQRLERLWPNGFSTVGDITFESAAYVARYITKKVTGTPANLHYQGRKPEYVTMSRRPGIGTSWLQRYITDVYPSDEVHILGRGTYKPPRFYDRILLDTNPTLLLRLKEKRRQEGDSNPDNSGRRLYAREEVKLHQIQPLTRSYEFP